MALDVALVLVLAGAAAAEPMFSLASSELSKGSLVGFDLQARRRPDMEVREETFKTCFFSFFRSSLKASSSYFARAQLVQQTSQLAGAGGS